MRLGKYIAVLLLLFAWNAHATTIVDTHFDALTEGGTGCAGYSGLPSPEIVSVSSPDPSNVIKVNFPDGFADGYNTMYCASDQYDSDEVYAQVYVFFPTGYQFHSVANKLSYTYLEPSGDNPGNFYIAVFGTSRQIAIHLQPAGASGTPNEVLYSGYTINTNTWYKLTWYMKLNTSGSSNGIVKMWVNDSLIYESYNRALRGGIYGTRNFYKTSLVPIFGGLNGSVKSGADYFYFDRHIVSTTAIGGGEGDTTDPYLDTFSPSDGATGVDVGTTSASFHWKDAGDGVSITTLDVGGLGCSAIGNCDAGLTATGTTADVTVTRTGLSFSYDEVFSEVITGSDSAGNAMSPRTWNFTIQADPNPALNITSTSLSSCVVGDPCTPVPTATGGQTPYSWDNLSVLPAGLSVAADGTSSWGTATEAFSGSVTLQVTDALSATDNQSHTFTINAATPTGQTTVEISAITDTFINSSAADDDTNYSDNAATRTYQWPSYTVANRGIFQIDLSSLPANIDITAATLELYLTGYDSSGGTDPMQTYVRRITGSLPTLSTVTWNSFAGTLGTAESYTDVGLTSGWYSFNVREMTGAAYTASADLYVSLDGGQDGASDTNRIFAAMDHGTAAYRPKLKVTYTQLTGPGERSPMTPGKVNVTANKINKFRSFR